MAIERPIILLFAPFTGHASLAAEPAWDSVTGLIGSHGAHVQIRDATDETVIVDDDTLGTHGAGYQITGLSLTPGRMYKARIRYDTGGTPGGWSPWFHSRVPIATPAFTELQVQGPPANGGALPVKPSFQQPVAHARPLHDYETESGHPVRRMKYTGQYRAARIIWQHISNSDRDTLREFLDARIDAAEAFASDDDILGSRLWWPRAGTIQEVHVSAHLDGVWSLSIDAEEVPE